LPDGFSPLLSGISRITMVQPVTIANPVYDSVFKFLLEDNEIAQDLISLITGLQITNLKLLPQEFTITVQGMALRRMDYAAEIIDAQGKSKKILIEMQKSQQTDELQHFRNYLGNAIGRPVTVARTSEEIARLQLRNERLSSLGRRPLPIEATRDIYPPVQAIYILGYPLSLGVQTMLLKAGSGCINLVDGSPLDSSMDEFIQSLTVTSFIIQLPHVPAEPKTDQERVLALFRHLGPRMFEIIVDAAPSDPPATPLLKRMIERLALARMDAELRLLIEAEEVSRRAYHQHYVDQLIEEERAREQLETIKRRNITAEAERALAMEREAAAQAEKAVAMEREAAAQAEKKALQAQLIRALAASGRSPEEITEATGIPVETCRQGVGLTGG
jgi:hypothetical protein